MDEGVGGLGARVNDRCGMASGWVAHGFRHTHCRRFRTVSGWITNGSSVSFAIGDMVPSASPTHPRTCRQTHHQRHFQAICILDSYLLAHGMASRRILVSMALVEHLEL